MCGYRYCGLLFFFFKQKTAYEMRISDWSSDVCSSDLGSRLADEPRQGRGSISDHLEPAARHGLRSAEVQDDLRLPGGSGELRPCYDPLRRRRRMPASRQRRDVPELHGDRRGERKGVVEGRRVSGGVDHGGGGAIK